jgi:dTDP-4-amino-4,6-dideoxygalactose transaminase
MTFKTTIDDLAIFGGVPAFSEKLHVGRPNISEREAFLRRMNDLLDRRWFTNNGPYVLEFERQIAELTGVRHAVAMCNATVALEIAIRALELTGEVLVPSFTFIATAHALQWQQITPVFCEIDPKTHNLAPEKLERMITPRTTGIIGVHVWGRPCDIESIQEIAQRRGLKLLLDAAHAFGCSYQGKMIGNFGEAEVFSFHATKFLNTFEGGAVVTNNDQLAEKIRLMRNFGFAGYDDVIYVGTNGKMTEPSAAMGLSNLESMDEFIAMNQQNYETYLSELADIPGLNLIRYDPGEKNNFHYVIVEIDETVFALSRDMLVKILHAENVLARRYFYPGCHQMEPYRSLFPHAGLLLPETEQLTQRVMSLPNGTAVTKEDVRRVSAIIRLVVQNSYEISQRLAVHG